MLVPPKPSSRLNETLACPPVLPIMRQHTVSLSKVISTSASMLNREQIESEDCLPIDFIFSH